MQLHHSHKSANQNENSRDKNDSLNQTKVPYPVEIYEGHESLSGIVDVILAVAAERKCILTRMRQALERGDDVLVLKLARQLCGVPDEKSGPTRPRIN